MCKEGIDITHDNIILVKLYEHYDHIININYLTKQVNYMQREYDDIEYYHHDVISIVLS